MQLLRSQQVEKAGISRTYYPGDWVDVGRHVALRWVADGSARPAEAQSLSLTLAGCGVSVYGSMARSAKVSTVLPSLSVTPAVELDLPYARTLLWDTELHLRPELIPVGFRLLDTWEVAIPLWSYDQLAAHIGTAQDRAKTERLIHDLRVPLYDSRLVFIRRCRNGEALIAAWQAERERGDEDRLALLRALYTVKPLLCALPISWNSRAA